MGSTRSNDNTVSLRQRLPGGRDACLRCSRDSRCLAKSLAPKEQLLFSRQRLSQLGLFFQMGQAMTSTFDTSRLFHDTIDLAMAVTDAADARLMLLNAEQNKLRYKLTRGSIAFPQTDHAVGKGIIGWVAQYGAPALVNDLAQDVRYEPEVDGSTGQGFRNLACVPLQIKGKVIGVLEVLNKSGGHLFIEEDHLILVSIAEEVAFAIRNAKVFEYVVNTYCKRRQGQMSCRGCRRPLGSWTPCVKYREDSI